MDKKEFAQELTLKLMPILLQKTSSAYPDADDENRWTQFIDRFVDKIYKKGGFTDLSK